MFFHGSSAVVDWVIAPFHFFFEWVQTPFDIFFAHF